MKCNVKAISYSRFFHAIAILVALAISVEARATPIDFSAELLEDDGRTFFATFWIDSSELDAQSSWIEEVNEFIGIVDGITYSWGPVLPDPPPFNAGAAYDAETGELVAIETPIITAVGHPSTINLRLLLDGTWTANTCIPLETCNPDYLFGTYTINLVLVPEPRSAALLLAGLLLVTCCRLTRNHKKATSSR